MKKTPESKDLSNKRIRGVSVNFSGKSLIKDPETGFLVPGHRYMITGFTPERKKNFIKSLQELGTPAAACRVVDIHYQTFQNHYKKDAEFKKQVDNAINQGKNQQRGEFELAMLEHGKKQSGFMWAMAWLRRNFPGEFDDRKVVSHTVGKEILDRLDRAAGEIEEKKVDIEVPPLQEQPKPIIEASELTPESNSGQSNSESNSGIESTPGI